MYSTFKGNNPKSYQQLRPGKREEERKNKALFDLLSASNLSHPIRSYFRPRCFALKEKRNRLTPNNRRIDLCARKKPHRLKRKPSMKKFGLQNPFAFFPLVTCVLYFSVVLPPSSPFPSMVVLYSGSSDARNMRQDHIPPFPTKKCGLEKRNGRRKRRESDIPTRKKGVGEETETNRRHVQTAAFLQLPACTIFERESGLPLPLFSECVPLLATSAT